MTSMKTVVSKLVNCTRQDPAACPEIGSNKVRLPRQIVRCRDHVDLCFPLEKISSFVNVLVMSACTGHVIYKLNGPPLRVSEGLIYEAVCATMTTSA